MPVPVPVRVSVCVCAARASLSLLVSRVGILVGEEISFITPRFGFFWFLSWVPWAVFRG